MTGTLSYTVPGMSCSHCEAAVAEEISAVAGVVAVSVDLETKQVVVTGDAVDDADVRAAIAEAGFEVT